MQETTFTKHKFPKIFIKVFDYAIKVSLGEIKPHGDFN